MLFFHMVCQYLFQQQEHLHDVDKVISVLHDLDAPLCVGNVDNKFHALKHWKSGRFLGRSKHRKYVPYVSLRSFQLRQRNENMDTSSSSKTNERWMSSEELKGKIHSLKKKNQKTTVAKLKRTQGKLAKTY